MVKCKEYKNAALDALRGNWAKAVLATIILLLVSLLLEGPQYVFKNNPVWIFAPMGVSLLFIYNIGCGAVNAFRVLVEKGDNNIIQNMFSIGFGRYFRILGGMLLVTLILFVGFLLFLIPGFILTYAYAMVPYLLVDEPDTSLVQCLTKSRLMMRGHKLDLFILHLSFLGWLILGILTLGIGMLWVAPYMYTAQGVFYLDLRRGTAGVPSEDIAAIQAE